MKLTLKYLFIGTIVTACVLLLFYEMFSKHYDNRDKPINVPFAAVWVGGDDGGNWIELVDIRKDTLRFRIYNDWNGSLLLDADFSYQNCSNLQLTKSNWSEYISYFDNTLGICNKYKSGNNNYCRLVPIYPVYFKESPNQPNQ